MYMKRCLSGLLTLAMVCSTGAPHVMAAENRQDGTGQTQISSAPETVYVNSYGAGERSVSFNDHWRFFLGEASGAEAAIYNDASWQDVNLPHDYSIDQGFTTAAPAEQENGYVLGGTGWYRKSFTLSEDTEGKIVSVDFDGVYMNATVYINGQKLGTHPYGYTPFSFELPAECLYYGGRENVLAVKVEHKQPSSRWYSGSGIYRDVNLTITDQIHVGYYGTTVTTPDIKEGKGTVQVEADVTNESAEAAAVSVKQSVYELDGEMPVAEGTKTAVQTVAAGKTAKITDTVTVQEPKLWTTEHPNMYTLKTEVYVGETLTDTYCTDFGFRWVEFTADNGFFLNGENRKLRGVSMHHDQGGLGSEAWYRAIQRQVEILKGMGVNAIRVTHNPASQVLIDICNREGMMLVEEAFDCWLSGKDENTEDYGKWFDAPIEEGNQITDGTAGEKWSEYDVKAMVKRGRNAPSIIMWSLGNEVFQSLISYDREWEFPDTAERLIKWVAEEDTTRYVTFGDNQVKNNVWADNAKVRTALVFASASDWGLPGGLVGFNYGGYNQISDGHNRGWLVYGSETASAVNSRGVYDRKDNCSDGGNGDRRLTSYDKSSVSWGHWASDGLWITMQQPYNAGEFVWTGFDYIGEPTPYNWTGPGSNGTWPNVAKNSYFGIIDTAGFPKDSFYLYQSQWNDERHTLHVLPVWNEEEIQLDGSGRAEVVVYSDAPVVKLYVNGKEVGTAVASRTNTPTGGYQNYTKGTGCFDSGKASGHTSLYATFNVPYEEGTLEAKAFEADGTTPIKDTDGRSLVETTGKAYQLKAQADRKEITADGKDLSYITFDVEDAKGRLVNSAEPEITVTVEGNGKLLALDNGVQNDVTAYGESTRKAGKGKLLAIVQSTDEAGSFTVKASARGYVSAETTVKTTPDNEETIGDKTVVSYEISRNYFVKQGETPVLPTEVKVNYADGSAEAKKVVWEEIPGEGDSYSVYGTIADLNLRICVNISVIGEVAGILNYSAAIGQNAELVLPSARPAVMADGTVLAAEFPVSWEIPADVTAQEGRKEILGKAQVFDREIDVTASVRVTNGEYVDGADALANAPEMYLNGVSSNDNAGVADIFEKLRDDKTGKADVAWSGTGTLDFRLDTAIGLKDFTLYLKDTAPTSDKIKVYSSANNGQDWTEIASRVTNRREDGVTVRTYTAEHTVSETWFRVELTKKASLLECEINAKIPTFPVGSEAALSSLKVGGYTADGADLEKGWFGVSRTDMDREDVKAVGKDNASVTILSKDRENVIRVLLESEDHTTRGIYQILLGESNSATDNAADASRDYPSGNMTLSAPSVAPGDPLANAKDGDAGTIWHSNWGSGQGPTDLTNDPDNRYLQMELKETEKIIGLRYLPRNYDKNGIVRKYSIKISTDGEHWTEAAAGEWTEAVEWKMASFKVTEAKYIRLYGVETASNRGGEDNKYMSAAEVRVRMASEELYSGNTTLTLKQDTMDYTGGELTPEPVVTYKASQDAAEITLVKGTDYEVSYRDNVEPGTATVIVTGKGQYAGVVEKTFTIQMVDLQIKAYEQPEVTTVPGSYPALPGTVGAETNMGQKLMEVLWDHISDSALEESGYFTVYGTAAATGARISAKVTVSGANEGQKKQYLAASTDERILCAPGIAAEGETVTVQAANGYQFEKLPVIEKSEDGTNTGIAVTEKDGTYRFVMPGYGVTVAGEMIPAENAFYTVEFQANGGSATETQKIPVDSGRIEEPEEPQKRGYVFAGWYRDRELTQLWNFVVDRAQSDMTLYAKWEEADLLVETEIPNYLIGRTWNLPGSLRVTLGKDTFDTAVTWNEEDVAKVLAAEELGTYPVRGVLADPEGFEVQVEVIASPGNVVYFVDSGASVFTEKGKMLTEANKKTIKNTVPDQAYDAKSGWGYTNQASDMETNGSGDAYSTIRNFKGGVNGQTLTYQFALEAGTYEITAGFYDPWAEWAGNYRHAKVFVTDGAGSELAAKADHHISGSKTTVQFTDLQLEEDGSVNVCAAPLKSGNDSCDMLISFLVITRKDDVVLTEYTVTFDARGGSETAPQQVLEGETAVRPADPTREGYTFDGWFRDEPCTQAWDFARDVIMADTTLYAGWTKKEEPIDPEPDEKKELRTAIRLAEMLAAENYTKESYQALATAIAEAKEICEMEHATAEQVQQQIDRLAEAVSGLKTVQQEQNEILKSQLEAKKQELLEKLKELAEAIERTKALEKELENLPAEGLKKGDSVTLKGIVYRVTDPEKKEAEAYSVESKNLSTINVAASVKIGGTACKVISIADRAFAGCRKAKKAVIGKNVSLIGKRAFYGDKSLKSITVKSKLVSKVGKQALKGIYVKAVIRVPKVKKKAYTKLLKGKGQKKTVKIA